MRESGEDYLETIYILGQKGIGVRAIDIANELNFSKPSITKAMKILKEKGLIVIDDRKRIVLTPSGLKIAQEVYERHQLITEFLVLLGVSEDNAAKDACRMEHDITDETFSIIKKYVNQNK